MWRQCKQLSLLKIYKFIQQKTASGLPGCGAKTEEKKTSKNLSLKKLIKAYKNKNESDQHIKHPVGPFHLTKSENKALSEVY